MNPDVSKAADKLAKLRAQADKYATPLAEAEAALAVAEEAEEARRAERATEYDRAFAASWRERAQQASDADKANRERFVELLAEEPWFMAYMESRAERHKREKIMYAAQRAQSATGQPGTVPQPRMYDLRLIEDLIETTERMAAEIGAAYAEELDAKRTAYIEATD
ncbi:MULTISPECIES: hypothetical protein [Kitasatospora]|uniref:Uncharacterized protein n=1 Tax=Kitasatospora setae (strain ATCC 33774 / DSM 43861 / JCM 3304 / KCC A-0304 / NBRC 14216 / KM-6054) TaxID=452652 RepID=E4N5S4_KITSK|nr:MULTISPECIES: hypothetical protein [Kitasatospora]BAJ26555.1 hypothetical protein KSE_07150 [Kitasatospora setae KM-6054]